MVRISPLVGMVGLKDGIANLNESNELYDCTIDTFGITRSLIESKDIEHKGFCLIGSKEFSENYLKFIDFSDPKPELGLELIDCKDFSKPKSETTVFSKPEPELDLIDFRDFSKLEPELIDFSDPEPKLEYLQNSKAIEVEMPLRVCTEKSDINKTEMGSESNDKVGIALVTAKGVFRSKSNDGVKISTSEMSVEFFSGILTGNFSKPSAELGRVQVARHNL